MPILCFPMHIVPARAAAAAVPASCDLHSLTWLKAAAQPREAVGVADLTLTATQSCSSLDLVRDVVAGGHAHKFWSAWSHCQVLHLATDCSPNAPKHLASAAKDVTVLLLLGDTAEL